MLTDVCQMAQCMSSGIPLVGRGGASLEHLLLPAMEAPWPTGKEAASA